MMTLKIHALLFNSNSNQLLASEIKFFNGVLETLDSKNRVNFQVFLERASPAFLTTLICNTGNKMEILY